MAINQEQIIGLNKFFIDVVNRKFNELLDDNSETIIYSIERNLYRICGTNDKRQITLDICTYDKDFTTSVSTRNSSNVTIEWSCCGITDAFRKSSGKEFICTSDVFNKESLDNPDVSNFYQRLFYPLEYILKN